MLDLSVELGGQETFCKVAPALKGDFYEIRIENEAASIVLGVTPEILRRVALASALALTHPQGAFVSEDGKVLRSTENGNLQLSEADANFAFVLSAARNLFESKPESLPAA